jgi:hypothetical protein
MTNDTSGKLHKTPHVRNNLDPICGRVAETGDLTSPFKKNHFITTIIKHDQITQE